MARALGRSGGRARARRLTADERRHIASQGGDARALSMAARRRIAANFRFAAAVDQLRGHRTVVRRVKRCDGPLPGIYPNR
jgi:hypothetical protein